MTKRKLLQRIYDVTQRLLHGKKVSYVVVYRGLSWVDRPRWLNDNLEEGQMILIEEQRTISSWSFSKEIAEKFINYNKFGFVVKAVIPAERIFAIIDIGLEMESVCISHYGSEEFEIVS